METLRLCKRFRYSCKPNNFLNIQKIHKQAPEYNEYSANKVEGQILQTI